MNLLILGRGKTGGLVAEVARERKHHVRAIGSADNVSCAALTAGALGNTDMVIDFTTPGALIENFKSCAAAAKSMVVGTTGWYDQIPAVRDLTEKSGIGFLYGANFSVGVNLFFEVARVAAGALQHDYHGQIFERHHVHKKDAPSGTAVKLQRIVAEAGGQ